MDTLYRIILMLVVVELTACSLIPNMRYVDPRCRAYDYCPYTDPPPAYRM